MIFQIFSGGPPRIARLYTWGTRYKKKSLIEPCAKVCQPVPKLSNEALLKKKSKIPDLVHRPTTAVAAKNRC